MLSDDKLAELVRRALTIACNASLVPDGVLLEAFRQVLAHLIEASEEEWGFQLAAERDAACEELARRLGPVPQGELPEEPSVQEWLDEQDGRTPAGRDWQRLVRKRVNERDTPGDSAG